MRRMPYSYEKATAQPSSRLSLDVVSFVLVASSMVLSYFIFTQAISVDASLAMKAAFMQSFALGGLTLRPAVLGSWNFRYLDAQSLIKSFAGGAVALGALIAAVLIPNIPLATLDFPTALFYANMGIVEEIFFNYFLFAWIASIYPWPVAALLCGGFFAPFHLGVYGFDPTFMAVSIVARVVLCAVYWITGSLSSAMGAHVAYNVIASPASVMALSSSPLAITASLVPALAFALAPAAKKLNWRNKNAKKLYQTV